MNNLDQRIRQLIDTAEPVTIDEVTGPRRPHTERRAGRRRLRIATVIALAAAVCYGVIAVSISGHHHPHTVIITTRPTPTSVPAPTGLRPLRVQVHLDVKSVVAGKPVRGWLNIDNHTDQSIPLASRCEPGADVGLMASGNENSYQPGRFTGGCRALVVAPGGSRFNFVLPTAPGGCVTHGSTFASYTCPSNINSVPDTAGLYQVVLAIDGVRLTPATLPALRVKALPGFQYP